MGSQGDFGQQIEHLSALTNRLVNQVDIDFGFAAGSDSVKQADIFLAERSSDFVESPLLVHVQRIERYHGLRNGFQSPHFLLIDLEHALVHQPAEHGRRGTRTLQQLGFGNFLDSLPAQETGEPDIFQQQVQLLWRPALQFVEEEMQPPFVTCGFGETHPHLRFRLVGTFQFFFHKEGVLLKQRLHYSEDILQSAVLLQPGHRLFRFDGQQVEHLLFALGKRLCGFEVGIILHYRLALQLQSRRQGRLVNISLRTKVIVGQPLPKFKLQGQQNGLSVEYSRHFLHFVSLWLQAMHITHNTRIEFLPTKGYDHPTARLYLSVHLRRQGIRKTSLQGQGQYDIDKLFHRDCKDTIKKQRCQSKRLAAPLTCQTTVSLKHICQ